MAENQTAAEDSGQSTQHQTHPHHNQQQQQQQQQHSHNDNSQTLSTQNSEELSSALTSPTTPPNENNSTSSPDEPQTIVIANHHQQQISQAQQPAQQQQGRSMIDRQVTTKIKTIRRNTIQTTTVPGRATSTTSIKKPALTKMNSLTGSPGNGENNITTTEKHHLQQQQQQQQHHHHQHNSMTNHHHHHHHNLQNNSSPSTGNNSNSTARHRTTTESLRLNAIQPISGGNATAGGGVGGDMLSNATSNSSIHSNLPNNSSSSASVAPKSTSTNASHSKSTTSKSSTASSKATSPNNNNSIASVTTGSSHASRSHHSQGHIQGQGHGHGHVGGGGARKPKTTSSFQITSVTVGHPKAPVSASDNGEEESADDLDESHTDDNSRITDLENETPSMSEDTFSKEEIYYHQDDALSGTAPVIPTSSQYGLVVATLGTQDISNVHVNVGENFINVVPSGSGIKKGSAQHRSERFKVVKIESTVPFRRGRWLCMDYLDHSIVSGKEDGSGASSGAGNNNEKTEAGGAVDNGEHAPKTTQSMILGPGAVAAMENHIEPSSAPTADGNWNFPDTTGSVPGGGTSTAPATVMHGMQQFVEPSEGADQQTQIMQQEPQYQTPPQEINANATPQMTMTGHAPPDVVPMDYATVAAQKLKKSLEELKKQEEAIAASEKAAAAAGGVYMPGQSQPVNFEQRQQLPMQQVAMQQQQQHASIMPGNINIQNGNISIASDNNNQVQQTQQQMMVDPQQHTHSLGYNVETVQQPMSPAPQKIQVQPSFVTASFQGTPQQTPSKQSPQMQETGQVMQHPQQPQQQMTTQQRPPPTQLQQQTSQTDGVSNIQNVAAVTNMQQQQQPHAAPVQQQQQQQLPPQFQQLQQQQQPLAPGQTMPILTQITSYDMQQQQQQHQLQHQQSAPATMLDNSALLASLQQQQHQQQHQQQQQSSTTNTMPSSSNIILQPASGSAPHQYQQQQQTQLPIDSAPPNSVSANSSNSTVNLNQISAATMIPITSSNAPNVASNNNNNNNNNTNTNIENQTILQSQLQQQQQQQQMQPPQQQLQQPSTSSQLHATQQQLQQNTETETERYVLYSLFNMTLTKRASGTSAVAIDNKIEQAMDLVKSHLMIAVREEVEVLKVKIAELMGRINQLELENSILRSNSSPETLQQVQMQVQLQIAGANPPSGSNMITGAPTPAAITAAPTSAAPTQAAAVSASSTAAATPQSNVGSGTATPTTTQQPTAAVTTVEQQNVEATQTTNAAVTDDSQGSIQQATSGPRS